MKRLIAALLALMMVLALCGCTPDEEPGGTVTPNENTTAEPEASDEEAAVSLGRMAGGVYTNEYAGFACTLDESWEYYSVEELQDLSGQTQEKLQDSALAEQIGKYDQFTDMMAECYDAMTTINVSYTRLSTADRLSFAMLSEEQLVDGTLQQKDLLIQTYAEAGIDVTSMDKTQVTFLGENHFAIYTVADIEGTPYYLLQLFRYNLGGQYYVTLTLASFMEDNTAGLLDLFEAA